MNIIDWFDVNNEVHINAYRTLCKFGYFPTGFVPKELEFTNCWQVGIACKLADAYVNGFNTTNKGE